MKTFSIPDEREHLHETFVYYDISVFAQKRVPLLDRHGELMGPWNARCRRKMARGKVNGVTIVRSLRRDRDDWTVREQTRFSSADFIVAFEHWWTWDFDPQQPFPYQSWTDEKLQTGSVWDELTGDSFGLTVRGSIGHFLRFVGVERSAARQIIDACEVNGVIDAQNAMISRMVLI